MLDTAKNHLEKAEEERMEFWTESVLTKLANSLAADDACPLCGSEDHPHVHVKSVVNQGTDWSAAEETWRKKRKLDFEKKCF